VKTNASSRCPQWEPKTEDDILDLLLTKEGDAEPSIEIQIPMKKGKFQRVFTLHSKIRAKTKRLKFPKKAEIPPVF
jgi:hypothetical protein